MSKKTSKEEYNELKSRLASIGQPQLLRFYDELDAEEQALLLDRISGLDFSYLERFSEKNVPGGRGTITPLSAMELPEIALHAEAFTSAGEEALRSGRIAAVCLAGGMGTRLGFDGPKGCFNIGVTHPVYIFQRLIENLLLRVRELGRWIHFFIMTSEVNDEKTRSFLGEHEYFGYDPAYIHFFRQEMAPAVDEAGKVLLESKTAPAVSPNGNGGWFRSLVRAGLNELLIREGIDYLNVFSVDNVLQDICDPCFIGAVLSGNYASGSKVVRKNSPDEKIGVMCLEDGLASVVEYSELSEEMRLLEDSKGDRVYNFGVILNYLFRVPELLTVTEEQLPLHFAHKKIPYVDEQGISVKPEEPNGWKFEYFIFDILGRLGPCLPYEVVRERCFAPVKNRSGVDSVESARALCLQNGIEL